MIVPNITGSLEYQDYDTIINRIEQFSNYEIIGKDESSMYDMYKIELGNRSKPKIMILSSLHGTEWQGTQYTLSFMEMLRDDVYPDKTFRDNLLNDFHIIYIPVGNPWGLSNTHITSREGGRNNSADINLNRDFYQFTQQETINIKNVMDSFKPFAFLDTHLIIARDSSLIVGNGQVETYDIRNTFGSVWNDYTGENVTLWSAVSFGSGGLARGYMGSRENPYTEHTLSYITEIGREADNTPSVNTNEDIYNYGMASLYIFFKTSIEYYNSENNIIDDPDVENVYKIVAPNKTVYIYRGNEGITNSIIEEFINGDVVETIINRDVEGKVTSFVKSLLSDGD